MKPKTHKTITRCAFEYLDTKLSRKMLEHKEEIIQGSEDEDIKDLILRGTNWHFFRSNKKIPHVKYLFCKLTSEDIFLKRIQKMEQEYYIRYNFAGRVLHHIQDMCTPSHVIPVYHGPKFPVYLQKGMIEDNFENFIERHDHRISATLLESPPSIEGLASLEQLYKETAHTMLHNILQVETNKPYDRFWRYHSDQEFDKIKGFGVYGEFEKYFKEGAIPIDDSVDISMLNLLEIQDRVLKEAIIATCKGLLLIDKQF